MNPTHPLARRDDIVVEKSGDELLVYDQRTDVAHRLNRTATVVWRHCDGNNTVQDLVAVLQAEVGDMADEDLVLISLDGLSESGLLEEAPERSREETRLSRRRFIRRVGVVGSAALLLPVVHSIVAPTPASAQSGGEMSCTFSFCYCYCDC